MRFLDLALDDVAAEIEVGLEGLRRLEALRGREVYPILSSLFLARRCDAPLRLQMRTINTLDRRTGFASPTRATSRAARSTTCRCGSRSPAARG